MAWYYIVAILSFLMIFGAGVALSVGFAVVKPRIRTLLLDADGTLLDFDRSEREALREAFETLSLPYDDSTHAVYHRNNDACWKALERGEITRDELKVRRFRETFRDLFLDADPVQATKVYEEALGHYAFPLEGAEDACHRLGKKYKLYLVTNGLKNVQTPRLLLTTIPETLDGIYISEEVGYAKPAAEFFDVFFADHPECKRSETLIVGDSLSGDILGGNNAGIPTCWVNRNGAARPADLRIDYEIQSITELEKVL